MCDIIIKSKLSSQTSNNVADLYFVHDSVHLLFVYVQQGYVFGHVSLCIMCQFIICGQKN